MLGRALLLIMFLAAIEIGLLIVIGKFTSLMFVLCLLGVPAFFGAHIARNEGLMASRQLANQMQNGRVPGEGLLDAVLVSVAAILLILPGVLSDLVAIALLFPVTRKWFKAIVAQRVSGHVVTSTFFAGFTPQSPPGGMADDDVIDVEVVESPPPKISG